MSDILFESRTATVGVESPVSAVSWAAIFAGAVAGSALSLALLALGAGIGLGSVSPWSDHNVSPTTFGVLAALWLIAVQLFASGVGGYLTGRLRSRWVSVHTDEVFFRDTAHGLLVWAVGAIIGAALLAGAVSSAASGAAHVGAAAAQAVGSAASGPAAQAASQLANPTAYFADMLFRSDKQTGQASAADSVAEAGRILARDGLSGDMPAADKTYLSQIVAARTGLSPADADKRVSDVIEQAKAAKAQAADAAKNAADAARKTGVYVALWVFISLLVGAFSASYMATVGGRVRDDLPMTG